MEKKLSFLLLFVLFSFGFSQTIIDGTITAGEYGNHTDGQNQQTNSGINYINWDDTNLYIGVSGANVNEGFILYLDKNPIVPVNGGTNADGTNVGQTYDSTNFAELPFRADVVFYVKNGYREYRTANGANGWSTASTGFGSYADNGSNVREFSIPWSAMGGKPTAFNFYSYLTSGSGSVYGTFPTENATGSIGTSARYSRYYTVSSTVSGSSTPPFSRNSYTFNSASDISSFGSISVYDFTMNTNGRYISRTGNTSGDWNISGNMVLGDGIIYLGTGGASYGNVNITNDLNLKGGIFDMDDSVGDIIVSKNVIIDTGAELKLSKIFDGDIKVAGDWTRHGTFTPRNRAVFFTGANTHTITSTYADPSEPTKKLEIFAYLLLDGSGNIKNGTNTNIRVTANDGLTLNSTNTDYTVDLNGSNFNYEGGGTINLSFRDVKFINSNTTDLSYFRIFNKPVSVSNPGKLLFDDKITLLLGNVFDPGDSVTTIKNVLNINTSAGKIINYSPIYGKFSTLRYSCGCNYDRGLEWTATSTAATNGLPNTVRVSGNDDTTVTTKTNLKFYNVSYSGHIFALGNLRVDTESSVDLTGHNGSSNSLNILKNLDIIDDYSTLYSSSSANTTFNFAGTGVVYQNINVVNQSTLKKIDFVALSPTKVRPENQDVALGTNSSFTVKDGATLDFSFDASGNTALNLVIASSDTGQTFNAETGSTLKITSPDGISSGGNYTGNVQVGSNATNRVFHANAIYHYVGKANQISGNGLPSDLSNRVIVELDTDALTFQPSGSNTMLSTATYKIIKGIALDNATGNIKEATNNTATLEMTGGRLRLFRVGPMPEFSAYTLTGGVVEYANTSATTQTINSGSGRNFLNIEVTGDNVGNSNAAITINGTGSFVVKDKGIFTSTSKPIQGNDPGVQTFRVENGGTFKTERSLGFSGSTTNVSVREDTIDNIILEDGSTVEYSKDNDQTINAFNPLPSNPTSADYSSRGYYNLKITGNNNTATPTKKTVLGSDVYVRNNLRVGANAILLIDSLKAMTVNKQVISSGALNLIVDNDANLVQIDDASTNTGNITVNRKAKMKRLDYTYWGGPVNGQNVRSFLPGTLESRFYVYNESNDYFDGLFIKNKYPDNSLSLTATENSSTYTFEKGKGYGIRASNWAPSTLEERTYNFVGVPNTGAFSVNLDYSGAGKGFNLVSNPYPSNLDLDKLYADNSGDITGTFYFWTNINPNPAMQGSNYPSAGYYNNYALYNASGGTPSAAPAQCLSGPTNCTADSDTPTKIVKPGQGFLVQSIGASKVLDFKNKQREKANSGTFFPARVIKPNIDRFWLQLQTPLNLVNTQLIAYKKGSSKNWEPNFDAKIDADYQDLFYSSLNSETPDAEKYIIQGRGFPFDKNDRILLGASFYQSGNHTISIANKEGIFTNDQSIYLKDNVTGIITDLTKESYTFTTNAGVSKDRFEIQYISEGTLGTNELKNKSTLVYQLENSIIIESTNPIKQVKIYDASGKLVHKTHGKGTKTIISSANYARGVYVLEIETQKGTEVKKLIK